MQSERVKRIGFSPTLKVSGLAKRMAAEGRDVLDLSVGQPDFPSPQVVKEAGHRAIEENRTGYTPAIGIPELRTEVAAKLRRENGVEYEEENIIVSPGAKATLYFLALTLFEQGDEVIIPTPYWVTYPEQVRMAEAEPVFVPSREENGFKLTALELESAITANTKAVILNYPSNPTGACYTRGELAELAAVCRERDIWVVADEIYEKLVYDGLEFTTIAGVHPDMPERTIIVNGMSKAFSMTGWRLGWAAGPRDVVSGMGKIQSHSTSNPTSISQWAGLEALRSAEKDVETMVGEFEARRNLLVNGLRELPGITCSLPSGAFYTFPNFSAYRGAKGRGIKVESDQDLAMYFLEEAEVAVVPGEAFGSPFNLRISYAASRERLEEGLSRMEDALAKLERER